jgi:arginine deiminase
MTDAGTAAAYGGPGWVPRATTLRDELGSVWTACGVASEWRPLEAVLLHRPGAELDVADADAALFLGRPDVAQATARHDDLAAAYRAAGIDVAYVDPPAGRAPPNLMYVADLLFTTPEGVILARPASRARAGEERWVARRLAELGVPILHSVRGRGVFEGADAQWLDDRTVLLATGPRTNVEGAAQVAGVLRDLGVAVAATMLPPGTMHLMGQLRFLDRDLAVVRRALIDDAALDTLRTCGYDIAELPESAEVGPGMAHNFVTLGPRRIIMPAGRPATQRFLASLGTDCITVDVDALHVGGGGIGCLTGVLRRRSE